MATALTGLTGPQVPHEMPTTTPQTPVMGEMPGMPAMAHSGSQGVVGSAGYVPTYGQPGYQARTGQYPVMGKGVPTQSASTSPQLSFCG